MGEIASAYVSLVPSARGFGSAMESQLGPEVGTASKGLGSKFGTAFKVGALAAVGGALIVGKFLKGAVEEAREAQKVTARTENVIKRMGNVAGISAGQVANLAGAISRKTGIDDEAIQSGQNLLLTFGNLRNESGKGNDIFNRTTQLMTDMSAAMGTDAKSSAIQLGKALNDPVKGVSALARVGVSFSEGQKKQIEQMVKHNDLLGAQKLILGEVEKQFGGAAEAMATPADKIAVAWGNVKEQIGTALLPVIDNVLNKILGWMPAITAGIDTAVGRVKGFVSDLRGMLSGSGDGLTGGVSSFASVMTGTVLPALQSAGQYLMRELLPSVMNVVNAFKYEFQQIAPIVVAAVSGLIARIAPYWPQIQQALKQVVSTFKSSLELVATIVRTGTDIVKVLWEKFGARFLDYMASTLKNVITIVRGALNIIQGVVRLVTSLIKGDWSGAWDAIKQILKGAWQIIEGVVRQGINVLKTMLSNAGTVLKAVAGKAWDLVKVAFKAGVDLAVAVAKKLPGLAVDAIKGGIVLMVGIGKDLIGGVISGIKAMAGSLIATIKTYVTDALPSFVKKALGISSPSKVTHEIGEWTMQGLADGIKSGSSKVLDAAKGVVEMLRGEFASIKDAVSGAFTSGLFDFDNVRDFMVNLVDTKGTLGKLTGAFHTLMSWGIDPKFLSALFSNGGAGLILDLANSPRLTALTAASLFGDIGGLSASLGSGVATADIGPELRSQTRELREIKQAIKHLSKDIGDEINGAVSNGHRKGHH